MACGDPLRWLVVTSTGLSPTNPYDDVPSFTDYEEWKALAANLLALAGEHYQALGALVGTNPEAFIDWTAIRPRRNSAVEKYDALPSSFLNFDPATNISDAMSAALESVCVIELCDDAIVKRGGVPPELPSAPPARKPDGFFSGAANLATVVVVGGAVLVGGAILLSRLRTR